MAIFNSYVSLPEDNFGWLLLMQFTFIPVSIRLYDVKHGNIHTGYTIIVLISDVNVYPFYTHYVNTQRV